MTFSANKKHLPKQTQRAGVVMVLGAFLMIVVCSMAAMGIDVGYMMVVKTQLQVAADAGALAGVNSLHLEVQDVKNTATHYTALHMAGGRNIKSDEINVEIGIWDASADTFTPSNGLGNAVRVTAKRVGESLFFGRMIGTESFSTEASAIAMANPKDIAFVMDLSGSMNDDTEPAWATETIKSAFGSSTIANNLMQDVYSDFNFGVFPGKLEYLGAHFGIAKNSMAYAELTTDNGPLSNASIPSKYRIKAGDSEATRRSKSYSWIIENQLTKLLPNAQPQPKISNFKYWEKYIDYVLLPGYVKSPQPPKKPKKPPGGPKPPKPPKPPAPPKPPIGYHQLFPDANHLVYSSAGGLMLLGAHQLGLGPVLNYSAMSAVYGPGASGPGLPRVGGLHGKYKAWLPPSQDSDRIDKFNNPNNSSFPSASSNLPRKFRNYFGYVTYVQFLMDHGRDLTPTGGKSVELSIKSGLTPFHTETVAGRSFSFPPRSQPLHAVRRSTIAALDVVHEKNRAIPSPSHRDHIAVITFDTSKGSRIHHKMTHNYKKAMKSIPELQAVGDKNSTTSTETGLMIARKILRPKKKGGQAREITTKVVVLLTDGIPNTHSSSSSDIKNFFKKHPLAQQYGGGYDWLDAALMQVKLLQDDGVDVYPVGIGTGTDYNFMDRVAAIGGTGTSPRGSGNPAEYEKLLTKIFQEIVKLPTGRLVE